MTTIFQCFKNYGSPTLVTRSKDAPNMTDPISTKDSDSRLKGSSSEICGICHVYCNF